MTVYDGIKFWRLEKGKLLVGHDSGMVYEYFGPKEFMSNMAVSAQVAMIEQALGNGNSELVDELIGELRELREEYSIKSR